MNSSPRSERERRAGAQGTDRTQLDRCVRGLLCPDRRPRRGGDDRPPRRWIRARRRARSWTRRFLAGERLGETSGASVLPCPRARDLGGGAVRVSRQAPPEARLRGTGGARRPPGDGPLRGAPGTRRGADAELREHRGVRGGRNDGRHVGDGRLVRADRCERPPLRRRRDRRGPRAAAGGPRRDRRRRLHRLAVHRGRGRPHRARGGPGCGGGAHREHPRDRSARTGTGGASRARPGRRDRRPRHPSAIVPGGGVRDALRPRDRGPK